MKDSKDKGGKKKTSQDPKFCSSYTIVSSVFKGLDLTSFTVSTVHVWCLNEQEEELVSPH